MRGDETEEQWRRRIESNRRFGRALLIGCTLPISVPVIVVYAMVVTLWRRRRIQHGD